MPFQIVDSDIAFPDVQPAGHPLCKCSRCGYLIDYTDPIYRATVNDDHTGEYRFHEHCAGGRSVPPLALAPEAPAHEPRPDHHR